MQTPRKLGPTHSDPVGPSIQTQANTDTHTYSVRAHVTRTPYISSPITNYRPNVKYIHSTRNTDGLVGTVLGADPPGWATSWSGPKPRRKEEKEKEVLFLLKQTFEPTLSWIFKILKLKFKRIYLQIVFWNKFLKLYFQNRTTPIRGLTKVLEIHFSHNKTFAKTWPQQTHCH